MSDDLYKQLLEEGNLLEAPQAETARQRKWRKLKAKSGQLWLQAQQGFMIGAMVGGGFGFITGFYYAWQSRKLLIIPMSTIISGASFGFIMGCGSMIRSDEGQDYQKETIVNGQIIPVSQFWMMKNK